MGIKGVMYIDLVREIEQIENITDNEFINLYHLILGCDDLDKLRHINNRPLCITICNGYSLGGCPSKVIIEIMGSSPKGSLICDLDGDFNYMDIRRIMSETYYQSGYKEYRYGSEEYDLLKKLVYKLLKRLDRSKYNIF